MEPHLFFAALLHTKGLTPSTLAEKIKLPKQQGTIWKFLNGEVGAPRAKWVQPTAALLGVNPAAFSFPFIAEEEARRLGVVPGPAPQQVVNAAPIARQRQAQIDVGSLLLQLGNAIRGLDEPTREAVAAYFKGVCRDPDRAPDAATKVRSLMRESGSENPSSKRQGTG